MSLQQVRISNNNQRENKIKIKISEIIKDDDMNLPSKFKRK